MLQGTMQHQLRQTFLHDSAKLLPVIRLHCLRLKKKETLERQFWKAFIVSLWKAYGFSFASQLHSVRLRVLT